MEVMIGVDPHKASHYAFAVDDGEAELAQVSVGASCEQVRRLLAWAEPFDKRDVGGRGCRRHGLPAVPATRRCRRTCR